MNIRQLRYFIAIVDEGSVSGAAQVLHIAQPALSKHISNLEDELTTDLLIRSSRGVKPTMAGQVLYQHARKIVSQIKQAADDVRKEADTPRGEVSIVLPPMLGMHIAPRLLEQIAGEFPEVELRIMEELVLGAAELVETGRADLGIVATKGEETRFDGIHTHSEPLFLVTRRRQDDPPCDGQGTVAFEEIFELPLVLSQGRHAVRAMVEETAASFDRRLNIKIATESSRLRMSYIRSGVTAGILPWPTFDSPWRRGELHARRITNPDLVRHVNLAWPRNHPLNAASRAVRERLFVICQELMDEGVIRGDWMGAELPA